MVPLIYNVLISSCLSFRPLFKYTYIQVIVCITLLRLGKSLASRMFLEFWPKFCWHHNVLPSGYLKVHTLGSAILFKYQWPSRIDKHFCQFTAILVSLLSVTILERLLTFDLCFALTFGGFLKRRISRSAFVFYLAFCWFKIYKPH